MMDTRSFRIIVTTLAAAIYSAPLLAQKVSTEDFTDVTTTNDWYYFNGACLTAGTSAGTGAPGTVAGKIPGCVSVLSSYYSKANDKDPVLVGGTSDSQTTTHKAGWTDNAQSGALRFTNGYPYGHQERGAIVSSTPFDAGQGVQITFKTVTYRGDGGSNSSGGDHDGADGMSFYLIDAANFKPGTPTWNGTGSFGGSLGYTCSNKNAPYDGLNGGYIGLGIDEYGNFLNGVNVTGGSAGPVGTATGDNTATGYGSLAQRIGLRGAGSVSWSYLSTTYPKYYDPTKLNTSALQQAAVQKTCQTGVVWDYSKSATSPSQVSKAVATLYDYAEIPNAYSVLPAKTIGGEWTDGIYDRSHATPIFYNLTITQDGLLSLSYAINGSSAYTNIIKNRSIAATNAIPSLPSSLYFGFAGSSGGSTNIHEILCFKAAPQTASSTSAAVSQQLATKIQGGAQVYFSYYNPNDWTGRLTANPLIDTAGTLTISAAAKWDAQCLLTGLSTSTDICATTGVAGPSAARTPSSRVMLTWNGSDTTTYPGNSGIPFEYSNLTNFQQNEMTAGDAVSTPQTSRVDYLRGVRTNEINAAGAGLYRARNGVLGDIIDSSPAWVGPPTSPYAVTWKDRYVSNDVMPENTGQTYFAFKTLEQSRLNVVYVGANDGFLHGFRSGSQDTSGNIVDSVQTPNDGAEIIAYMPGAVLDAIHQYSTDPAVEPSLASGDLSNSLYAHNFFVDAPPGTGDLYYQSAWHTWVVGGLGAGGNALFALDVTNPAGNVINPNASTFAEVNAGSNVVGEWAPGTITCPNVSTCSANLGNTYGTPLIRRFHNGSWGVIFGNGFGSSTGDAGIFIMLVDPSTAMKSFYYLTTNYLTSTSVSPTPPNGIAYTTAADFDGDHITDFIYAGDLQGNVWRFDVTDASPTNWAVTPGPLFQTQAGQPITTPIVLATSVIQQAAPSVILTFGTGQRTQFTTSTPLAYAPGPQSIYGVWDWNFSKWNSKSAFTNASLNTGTSTTNQTGLSAPYTLTSANLQQQTYTASKIPNQVDASNTPIVWRTCNGTGTTCNTAGKFGWYVNLPGKGEQIVSNPSPFQQGILVNSTVPANNQVLSCSSANDTGVTYIFSPLTGGTFTDTSGNTTSAFVNNNKDSTMVGSNTNETGALTVVTTAEGGTWAIGQSITPPPGYQALPPPPIPINLPPNVLVNRKTWTQLR